MSSRMLHHCSGTVNNSLSVSRRWTSSNGTLLEKICEGDWKFRLVVFNDYYSFIKEKSTAKLPVYQKPYPLELIFFVVPHRQSANFSLRKRRTLHKNHLPNKTIRYNLKPAPGSRPRTSTHVRRCGPSSPGVKAPPPRHGGARFGRVFNSDVCVSRPTHTAVHIRACGSGASPRVDRAPCP